MRPRPAPFLFPAAATEPRIMIHTIYSNSYQVLRDLLVLNCSAEFDKARARDGSAATLLEQSVVLVPGEGVENDLSRHFADVWGTSSSVRFTSLGAWFYRMLHVPGSRPEEEARWLVWSVLGDEEFVKLHPRLSRYLAGADPVKRMTLSSKVASLFVQYLTHRLDWVMYWLKDESVEGRPLVTEAFRRVLPEPAIDHEDALWQAALMRELLHRHPDWSAFRVLEGYQRSLEKLLSETASLSTNCHVFLPASLPPNALPLLRALAGTRRADGSETPHVWIYLLNPSSECWFDWAFADQLVFREDDSVRRNPLLRLDGQSTRAVIDRVWRFTFEAANGDPRTFTEALEWERSEEDVERGIEGTTRAGSVDFGSYARPDLQEADFAGEALTLYGRHVEEGASLLASVQNAVYDDAFEIRGVHRVEDRSIECYRAPNDMREVETVVAVVQSLLQKHRPEEILVVTPDIGAKAPLITEAVESLPRGQGFPYRIAGLDLMSSDPLSRAFAGLLRLVTGRAERAEFLEWLSQPVVEQALSLTPDAVEVIGGWLADAGYRYGLSDAHLKARDPDVFSVPGADTDMTLSRAVERLLTGFMLPEAERRPYGDVLPVDGTVSERYDGVKQHVEWLDVLVGLSNRLEELRSAFETPRTLLDWYPMLLAARAEFLDVPPSFADPESLGRMLEKVCLSGSADTSLVESVGGEVPAGVLASALEGALHAAVRPAGRRDAVTFTNMKSFESVSFGAVVVFGMNEEGSFPGTSTNDEFDLIHANRRRGDRDRRVDNRNLFLDAVLQAGSDLVFSYVGGETAEKLPPSIVLEEFLSWVGEAADRGVPVIDVPLSPFDEKNFTPAVSRAQSHSREALDEHLAHASRFETAAAGKTPVFADAPEDADQEDAGQEDVGQRDAVPEGAFLKGPVTVLPSSDRIDVDRLAAFIKKPAREVLRHAAVTLPRAEAVDDALELRVEDNLTKWIYENEALQTRIAAELGCADEDRIREERWKADPRLGPRATRDDAARELAATAAATADAFSAFIAKAGLRPVAPRRITATVTDSTGRTRELMVKLDELYENGERRLFRVVVDRKEKPAPKWILREVLVKEASEGRCPHALVVVNPKKTLIWCAPKRFLEEALRLYDESRAVRLVLSNDDDLSWGADQGDPAEPFLWRGNPGRDAAIRRRKAFLDALGEGIDNMLEIEK